MVSAIDFGTLTEGKVHNLSGHDRGLAARRSFRLDELDTDGVKHLVRIPDDIYGISPSFIQGLFADTLRSLNNSLEEFERCYEFEATDLIQRQIARGLQNILIDRTTPIC